MINVIIGFAGLLTLLIMFNDFAKAQINGELRK